MSFESLADLLKLNQDACNWISVQRNTQLRSRDDFGYWLPVSLQKITDFAQIGMNDGARILRRYRHIPLDDLAELSESNYYYTCYSTLGQKETVTLSACSAVFDLTAMLFELRLETSKALSKTFKHAGKFTQPEPKQDAPYGPDWIEQFQRSEFWWPMRSMSFCPEFEGVSIIELQKASQMELRLWWRSRTEHGQNGVVSEDVVPPAKGNESKQRDAPKEELIKSFLVAHFKFEDGSFDRTIDTPTVGEVMAGAGASKGKVSGFFKQHFGSKGEFDQQVKNTAVFSKTLANFAGESFAQILRSINRPEFTEPAEVSEPDE